MKKSARRFLNMMKRDTSLSSRQHSHSSNVCTSNEYASSDEHAESYDQASMDKYQGEKNFRPDTKLALQSD
ncbi:hypothetical protein DAI22_06g195300 [Oryza sativa Japonica Group]|nr:hypothetical protein DAI22_06g195300 [Oryza sativa Japonica Group]